MTKYYRLANTVQVRGNVVTLDGIELFETNADATRLMDCVQNLSVNKWFTLRELIVALGLEDNEENAISVHNVLDYLKRCFVLDEEERE